MHNHPPGHRVAPHAGSPQQVAEFVAFDSVLMCTCAHKKNGRNYEFGMACQVISRMAGIPTSIAPIMFCQSLWWRLVGPVLPTSATRSLRATGKVFLFSARTRFFRYTSWYYPWYCFVYIVLCIYFNIVELSCNIQSSCHRWCHWHWRKNEKIDIIIDLLSESWR